jgi:nitroreductase
MSVRETIEKRRAYRSLDPAVVEAAFIDDLAATASLAPSCMNNQPWRFIFVNERPQLEQLFEALSPGNAWAKSASLIVAVVSGAELDCRIQGRDYYLFDTGLATAFMVLRATELGWVAHPIAGFDEMKAKEILGVPAEMQLITLVIVGKKSETINPSLSENMRLGEAGRPERLPLAEIARENHF